MDCGVGLLERKPLVIQNGQDVLLGVLAVVPGVPAIPIGKVIQTKPCDDVAVAIGQPGPRLKGEVVAVGYRVVDHAVTIPNSDPVQTQNMLILALCNRIVILT